MFIYRAGIHTFLVRITNSEDPDLTASERSSLIWVFRFVLAFWRATGGSEFLNIYYIYDTVKPVLRGHSKIDSERRSLIWIFPVCLGLLAGNWWFGILEHLLYI